MALSRSMKNLMHDAAQARRGGGNPNPGDDVSGTLPGQQARLKTKMMQARQGAGGGMMRPAVEPRGPAGRRGPGTVAGKPRPPAGTFGFAARGGGGTPALQGALAGAKRQQLQQRGAAAATGRPPAALAPQPGGAVRERLAARAGPPARRGGMARALGSGGSRRRMLR